MKHDTFINCLFLYYFFLSIYILTYKKSHILNANPELTLQTRVLIFVLNK